MKNLKVAIDFENSIGPWLGRTVKLVDCHMNDLFLKAGLDLSKEQMVVLKKLDEQDGLNQNELAELVYRDKSSLARLLKKMQAKEYIVRKKDANDKRINQVFLTIKGKEVFQTTRPIIKTIIDRMEYSIGQKQKHQMIELLKTVQKNLDLNHTFNKSLTDID